MRRSRFSEERIISVLNEHEAGMKTADVCRKHGISDAAHRRQHHRRQSGRHELHLHL